VKTEPREYANDEREGEEEDMPELNKVVVPLWVIFVSWSFSEEPDQGCSEGVWLTMNTGVGEPAAGRNMGVVSVQ